MDEKINKSASRTIEILDFLARSDRAPNLTEISQVLEIPKSSCFEILQTLIKMEAVEEDLQKTYRVGIKIFQIGSKVLTHSNVYTIAHEELKILSEKVNQTVYLAIHNSGKIVYVDKVVGKKAILSSSEIGETNFMHLTGLGKALLAGYSQDEVLRIIEKNPLISKTKFSITSREALEKDLIETRNRGYAIDNRESMELVRCVAAPVFDGKGIPIAAISITTLATHVDDKDLISLAHEVTQVGLSISQRMGYGRKVLYG